MEAIEEKKASIEGMREMFEIVKLKCLSKGCLSFKDIQDIETIILMRESALVERKLNVPGYEKYLREQRGKEGVAGG